MGRSEVFKCVTLLGGQHFSRFDKILFFVSVCTSLQVCNRFVSASFPGFELYYSGANIVRSLLPVSQTVSSVLERRRSAGVLPSPQSPETEDAVIFSARSADRATVPGRASQTHGGFLSGLGGNGGGTMPSANLLFLPDLTSALDALNPNAGVEYLMTPFASLPMPLDNDPLAAAMANNPFSAAFDSLDITQALNPAQTAALPTLPPLFLPLQVGVGSSAAADKQIEAAVGQAGSLVHAARVQSWRDATDSTITQTNEVLNMHGLPPLRDPWGEAGGSQPLDPVRLGAIQALLDEVVSLEAPSPSTVERLLETGLLGSESVVSMLLPPVQMPENNIGLARSAWPISHCTGFSQAASPYYGPDGRQRLAHSTLNRVAATQNPINLLYTVDHKYVWGSSWTSVFKVDRSGESLRLVDYVVKPFDDIFADKFHGAYSLLTAEGVFLIAIGPRLDAFFDAPGSGGEKIVKHPTGYDLTKDFSLSHPRPARDGELIRALCMSSDGHIVYGTTVGRVGILSRDVNQGFTRTLDDIMLGAGVKSTLDVSNNVACDDYGNVYVVSSKLMHKVHWDGNRLSIAWEVPYGSGNDNGTQSVRLGEGSGSTPSLMGNSPDDLYIVISDGSEIMNVVVIAANNGRIVATHPINFGDPTATHTSSEQSLLVHGWRIVVVNNTPDEKLARGPPFMALGSSAARLMGNPEFANRVGNTLKNAWPVIAGDAPRGAQQLEFDPNHETLRTSWVNPSISIPNGIPTLSAPIGIWYGFGKRGTLNTHAAAFRGMWTLEALDWWTGKELFYYNIGIGPWYNSIYAATQVGPHEIISGTASGMVQVKLLKRNAASDAETHGVAVAGRAGRQVHQIRARISGGRRHNTVDPAVLASEPDMQRHTANPARRAADAASRVLARGQQDS